MGLGTGTHHAVALQSAREAVRTQLLTIGAGAFAAGALVYTARNFTLSRGTTVGYSSPPSIHFSTSSQLGPLQTMQREIEQLNVALASEFDVIGAEIRRRVADLDSLNAIATRPDGDVTHSFDRFAEDRIIRVLSESRLDIIIMSEESSAITIGTGIDFMATVDPVDKSNMVARGYPYGSIAISLVDRSRNEPVLSRIYEIFTSAHYSAIDGIAMRNSRLIHPSRVQRLEDAFIVSYAATRERRLSRKSRKLFESRAQLFLDNSGSLDIAKVGAGQCDGVVETVKGYYPRDFLPGFHIATCAGAVSCALDGSPVKIITDKDIRTTFLIAANEPLLKQMRQAYS